MCVRQARQRSTATAPYQRRGQRERKAWHRMPRAQGATPGVAQGCHRLLDGLIIGIATRIDHCLQLHVLDGAAAISVGRVEHLAETILHFDGESVGHDRVQDDFWSPER